MTSDDEERRASLVASAKKSSFGTQNILLEEKDVNVLPACEPSNTTAHNDEEFLNDLINENKQLEAEYNMIMSKKITTPHADRLPLQESRNVQPNTTAPCEKKIVSVMSTEQPENSCTSPPKAPSAQLSPRSTWTKENCKTGNEPEQLGKKCRSLQLRLTGAQKAMKNMENVNKMKDDMIAELKEQLTEKQQTIDNMRSGRSATIKPESDTARMNELENMAANAKNRALRLEEEKSLLQKELKTFRDALGSQECDGKTKKEMDEYVENG